MLVHADGEAEADAFVDALDESIRSSEFSLS